jgi:hypothetical protein
VLKVYPVAVPLRSSSTRKWETLACPRDMPDTMALSPNASNQSARNILGRPAQYSWMQQNPILSQPPLRASGKHLQRQAPTPIASDPAALSYQSPATLATISSPTQDPEISSPLHEALQPSPLQEAGLVQEDAVPDSSNSRNFLPSPTPSDHDKSPSPPATRPLPAEPTARQPPNEPIAHQPITQPAAHQSPSQYTLHQSPVEPAARLPSNRRPASTTSSSRQPSTSTPILQPRRASNTPTAHTRLLPPNTNNAPPFGPQWSAVFSSADCIKRISDFVAAHRNLNEADLERLGVLYDATTQNDWYFGILLMLLACHSLNLPSLQPIQVYLPQNSLPMFARLLGEQSDGANSLSHEVQLFISSFPKPLDELRACLTDQSFGLAIRNIASCLHQITLNLDRVLLQSRHAETLPTVHDLIASLGICSLLFQRATFRFLLRNTWGSDSGPMAESAMRQFTIEQQRFGIEGGHSPEMRLHQQKLYRDMFHQHIRATHSPHALMTPTTNPLAVNTATPAQQPALASTVSTFHDTGTAQSQLPSQLPSPRSGQHRDQIFHQAQMVRPTGSKAPLTAQMEMQMRMQREMQMRAQAHAHAQAQAQAQVQPPFPVHFQNQPQGPSLPAAYYQNTGSTLPPQFQQGPHQSVLQNTVHQDVAQVQAIMMYQQQTHPQQMQPQQPVLTFNYPPTPSITTQGPRPYQARSDPPPRLFFPEPNSSVPQPANPDFRRSALHQAHLRSPLLVPKMPATPASVAPNDHYRRIVGFALPPHRLAITPVQEIPFQLSPQAIGRLLKVKASIDGDPPSGEVDVDSITLRLRCCQVAPSQPLPTENRWVLIDGSWPVQAYFTVNKHQLEPRRKLHHGKYIPIDITHCVGDSNKLVVRINRSKYDKLPFNYAVAIEVVGFATRNSIKEDCMKRIIPAAQILDSIKKSLISDDDDIVMQSNFTLQLYEPFSNARIFDLPVRSQDCLHKQAFDLDVFLDTRLEQQSKPPKGRISKVDAWRCPICKADSRPQRLIVDGFLMAVRESLAAKNMLKTRAISVESDGSWTPVHEAHDEESEDEATPAPKKNVEIIEIDDD